MTVIEQRAELLAFYARRGYTPTGATDVSLQFSLGRLYFFSGALPKAIDTLTKVVDRGSLQTVGLVMDVGSFLHDLIEMLGSVDPK